MKKAFLTIFLLICQVFLFAQNGNLGCLYDSLANQMCSSFQIVGDKANICNDGVKVYLQWNTPTPPALSTTQIQQAFGSTDSYTVVQKPNFTYLTQTNPISAGLIDDDEWSNVINLPFKFCFFENKYTSLVVGANGSICFNTNLAGGLNGWNSNTWVPPTLPINNPNANNCILGAYYDIDPSVGGSITYSVEGVAPCRRFIVNFNAVPLFNCNNLICNQQIVLHESSYQIDVNIQDKPTCLNWNGGKVHLGIQNNAGNKAFVAPGWNGTTISANNVSFSFIPSGKKSINTNTNSITNGIHWVDSVTNNVIASGDTLVWFPSQDTTVYVFFGDTNLLNSPCFLAGFDTCINVCGKGLICPGSNPYVRFTVFKAEAFFTFTESLSCKNATLVFQNQSINCNSYQWDFGDGTTSTLANPTHVYNNPGTYTITLIGNAPQCIDTYKFVYTPNIIPPNAVFNIVDDSICSNTPAVLVNGSTGNYKKYQWNMGDGTIYNTLNVSHTYNTGGSYLIQLILFDTVGNCSDTMVKPIFVDTYAPINFTASSLLACAGDFINFNGTVGSNASNFYYTLGDGDTIYNNKNITKSYLNAGTYNVVLNAKFPICPSQSISKTITMGEYPIVDLGPPESLCVGSETITIADTLNPTSTHLWSTGSTLNSINITQPGTYSVTVSNGQCAVTAVKVILTDLDCVSFPNAFSPNNAPPNNYFRPVFLGNGGLLTYELRIFNRYGEEIYKSLSVDDPGWDGKYKNKICDPGIYVYTLKLIAITGEQRIVNGDIFLMR